MSDARALFFTRHDTPPEGLYGHAFEGADLVFGRAGQLAFEQASGRRIGAGLDGSYVLVGARPGGSVEIGTDLNGHGKIFLYRSGAEWAVSNSFYRLVEGVHARGWPITLDRAHLGSFFVPKALGAQLVSLHTSVREIRLLPSHARLVCEGGAAREVRQLAPGGADEACYEEALSDFLSIWVSRLATLLASEGQVVCDVTGGLDSRASLALMRAAGRLMGNPQLEGLHLNSNRSSAADYAVAERLARRMGMALHEPPDPFSPRRLGSAASYEVWKANMLGTYGPLFWPAVSDGRGLLWVGGDGGESNRKFYGADTAEKLLGACRQGAMPPEAEERLFAEAMADLAAMAEETGMEEAPILHYRQFRERFHGARRSAYSQSIAPLASLYAKRAADRAGQGRIDSGQVLRDIMANAAPDILDEPFEKASHPHGSEAVAHAAKVQGWQAAASAGGKVWGMDLPPPPGGVFRNAECFDLLARDFAAALPAAEALGFFPAGYLALARQGVAQAVQGGKLDSNAARPVTHVMLAGLLARVMTAEVPPGG